MRTGTDTPKLSRGVCLEAAHMPKHQRQCGAPSQEVRTGEALTPVHQVDQKDGG